MRRLSFVLAALAFLAVQPALAQPRNDDRGRPGGQAGEVLPLGSILQRLRMTGRLLDANLGQGPGGRAVYILRVLERDGRVRNLTVDARSGELLGGR